MDYTFGKAPSDELAMLMLETDDFILKGTSKRSAKAGNAGKLLRAARSSKSLRSSSGGGLYSLKARDCFTRDSNPFNRRAVAKAYVSQKRDAKDWQSKQRAHLEYIQREGVELGGDKGVLFSREGDFADANEFLNRSAEDKHQFRFIVSPEDGHKLDMKSFTHDLMHTMERDLGTKLDWVAAVHYNTDHPHVHIVVRGVDEDGKKLCISKDYISHGIRNRAQEISTQKLGFRTEQDIKNELERSIEKERTISLDYVIQRNLSDGKYRCDNHHKNEQSEYIKLRLEFLESMSLAKQESSNTWKLKEGFIEALKDKGMRNDIIKIMHRENSVNGVKCEVFNKIKELDKIVTGKIVKRGFVDEIKDSEFVVIKDNTGKHFYAELSKYSETNRTKIGDTVELSFSKQKEQIEYAKKYVRLKLINSPQINSEKSKGMRR